MKSMLRLIAAGSTLLVADAVFSYIGARTGIHPDVFLAGTVFAVLYQGHAPAVAIGFLLGMLSDFTQPASFGTNAFRLATIGYVFGWLHGRFNEDVPHVQAGMLAAASCVGILIAGAQSAVIPSMPINISWRIATIPIVNAIFGTPMILLLRYLFRNSKKVS